MKENKKNCCHHEHENNIYNCGCEEKDSCCHNSVSHGNEECGCHSHSEHHEHDECGCHSHNEHHEHDECSCHTHHKHKHTCCSHDGCSCGHDHENTDTKTITIRIIIGALLFIAGLIFNNNFYLFVVSYLILGADVVINGIKQLFTKGLFSEYLLMSIASIGAFILGQYAEGCAVMLFYQVGELFCDTANGRTKKSIRELIDIKPEYANLIKENRITKISPEKLVAGDIVVVSTGEKIPSDGVVIEGKTQLDTSKMTGEAEYCSVTVGDEVISGCINNGSLIKVQITTSYNESSISKVTKLLEEIESNKSESEKFISVFAKYYTPIVVILALLIGIIPPLFLNQNFSDWIYRALLFLVVSCPCALVISVPLAFFSANGCASKSGILIKGSIATEKLAGVKTLAFDKTGTLTHGSFKLEGLRCNGIKSEVFEYLAYAEYYSTHPLSQVVEDEYVKLFGKEVNADRISDYVEIAGRGISVTVDGKQVLVGNEKLLTENNIVFTPAKSNFTVSYIAVNSQFCGYAEFSDGIKDEAKKSIEELKKMKISPVLLSGDKKETVDAVGSILEIRDIYSQLLPQDKVKIVKELQENGRVAFTGDGINDAPVIALADVGISMGLEGSDAAIEASDVVILSDDISKIPLAVKISKKTMGIVWQNIIFSIGIKLLIMILGAFGIANLWIAVFGDVGVSVLAVVNALRALRYEEE